ncbi:MAG: dipeptidase [Thomasclavelia sp.]|nr:dipeptidase [Thomasclavelia sp.]
MHCDIISNLYHLKKGDKDYSLFKNNCSIDLKKMKEGNYLLQNFAIFVDLKETDNPFKTCNEMIDLFDNEIKKNSDLIKQVKSYQDIDANKLNALLTIEEGSVVNNDLNNLDYFYKRGVRMITLTWNYKNGIGYPNLNPPFNSFEDLKRINDKDGLTPFGIEYIKRMEDLGIIIDVSHLGDAGFYDVYNNTTKPFVASHSNARSVCNVARNLTDDMIIKLANRGGVMGINFCGDFLVETKEGDAKSCIKDMIKHINYITNLVGVDYVGLGSDYDGIDSELEMPDCSQIGKLKKALQDEGYSNSDIDKILYKNVLRVYKAVL